MTQPNITYINPIMKNTHYYCSVNENISFTLIDTIVKQFYRTKNGYVLKIFLTENDKKIIDNIDNIGLATLLLKSKEWLNSDLVDDDIEQLYTTSYCKQTHIMDLMVTDKTRTKINDVSADFDDITEKIKDHKFQFNVKIQYLGMAIYKEYTKHRWIVKEINMNSVDDIRMDSKETIEEFWENMVNDSINELNVQINKLENKKKNLKKLILEIKEIKNINNSWESKISEIQGLVQNIIF